jgi:hypothetical protein
MKLSEITEGQICIVAAFGSSLHGFLPGAEVKVHRIQGPHSIVCYGLTEDGKLNYQILFPEQLKKKG